MGGVRQAFLFVSVTHIVDFKILIWNLEFSGREILPSLVRFEFAEFADVYGITSALV
jgi:hypothetical protein